MIIFNKVTWYSRLYSIIFFVGILPALTFYIGTQYQITEDSFIQADTIPADAIKSVSPALEIEGISPQDILYAPVPLPDYTSESTTTLLLKDPEGKEIHFNKGHASLNDFFHPAEVDDLYRNYSLDIQLLGYARMGHVPIAVTLVNENSGGTGYFPSIVLYRAENDSPKIFQIIPIKGDRIEIKSLLIKDDFISLTFSSNGDQETISKEYSFTDGKLSEIR